MAFNETSQDPTYFNLEDENPPNYTPQETPDVGLEDESLGNYMVPFNDFNWLNIDTSESNPQVPLLNSSNDGLDVNVAYSGDFNVSNTGEMAVNQPNMDLSFPELSNEVQNAHIERSTNFKIKDVDFLSSIPPAFASAINAITIEAPRTLPQHSHTVWTRTIQKLVNHCPNLSELHIEGLEPKHILDVHPRTPFAAFFNPSTYLRTDWITRIATIPTVTFRHGAQSEILYYLSAYLTTVNLCARKFEEKDGERVKQRPVVGTLVESNPNDLVRQNFCLEVLAEFLLHTGNPQACKEVREFVLDRASTHVTRQERDADVHSRVCARVSERLVKEARWPAKEKVETPVAQTVKAAASKVKTSTGKGKGKAQAPARDTSDDATEADAGNGFQEVLPMRDDRGTKRKRLSSPSSPGRKPSA